MHTVNKNNRKRRLKRKTSEGGLALVLKEVSSRKSGVVIVGHVDTDVDNFV